MNWTSRASHVQVVNHNLEAMGMSYMLTASNTWVDLHVLFGGPSALSQQGMDAANSEDAIFAYQELLPHLLQSHYGRVTVKIPTQYKQYLLECQSRNEERG